jgi:hypothetical protein
MIDAYFWWCGLVVNGLSTLGLVGFASALLLKYLIERLEWWREFKAFVVQRAKRGHPCADQQTQK